MEDKFHTYKGRTMATIDELVKQWRAAGPVAWAESAYGWIDESGQPVTLEPWQRAALEAYWQNRERVTTFAISNVKKTGKTFLDAVLLAWRWLALPGEHYAVGNDLDQSSGRQFSMIAEMAKRHPLLSQYAKVTRNELTFSPTGSTLKALAVDAAGNAGANHLTVSHTEAWGIIYEAGIRAWEELTPPPGRRYGFLALRIADSYAGYEGESKTWHDLVDQGLQGEPVSEEWPLYLAGRLLLFHMGGEEAQRRCFRGKPEEAREYYADQARTLRTNAYRRQHLNERTSGESAYLPEGAWEACRSEELKPLQPGERVRLTLAADASTSRDCTALVGTVYNHSTQTVDTRLVKVWKPQRGILRRGKPTIDLAETLGAAVEELHQAGNIDAIVIDPYQLHSLAIEWEKRGIKVIELAQNAGRVESDQALYDAVMAGAIRHYGDATLSDHLQHAVAIETVRGIRIAKEKTSLKIDAAVALSMAHWGALESGKYGSGATVIKDPFAIWPPPEGAEYDTVNGWHEPYNKRPHKPGVTWRNCRYRNHGCEACIAELEAEGQFDSLAYSREFWEQSGGTPEPHKQPIPTGVESNDYQIQSKFWQSVRGRMGAIS